MSEPKLAGQPPGWYPDPNLGRNEHRYWDGNTWTVMTAPAKVVTAPRRTARFTSLTAAVCLLVVLVVLALL
jgi:hypothetical protein